MKKLNFIFVFATVLFAAQTNRFIYEYKYVPNTNEKDTVRKEMMLLEINEKGSRYFSHSKFISDSITKADLEKQLASGSNNININKRERLGSVNYSVEKTYPDFNVFLMDRIGTDNYKISEEEKLVWKVQSEVQKIGEYSAQKATTSFGGRDWTAWFSTEIPFQDGPYKFYGLPGLIVKIEDTTSSHIMTLVANKKVNTTSKNSDADISGGRIQIFGMGGKEIPITEKQFKKLRQDFLNDPSKNMREMMMRVNPNNEKVIMKMKTPDGREISDMNEMYKQMEKRTKEAESKNNNRIEPDLYK